MSLLLDALEEAQKQRRSAEENGQSKVGQNEETNAQELELELELDLESTEGLDLDSSNILREPQGINRKASPEGVVVEESKSGQAVNARPQQDLKTEQVSLAPRSPIPTISKPEETGSAPIHNRAVNSPSSANAVFRNRGRGKAKRPLLLGLALLCLILLGLAGYLYFFAGSFSAPLQASLRTQNIVLSDMVAAKKPLPADAAAQMTDNRATPQDSTQTKANSVPLLHEEVQAQEVEMLEFVEHGSSLQSQENSTVIKQKEVEIDANRVTKRVSVSDEKPVAVVEEPFTGIQIRKRRIPAKQKQNLRLAQQALASGEWLSAEAGFGAVLKVSPANVSALLGIANLSVIKGQNTRAEFYYQRVLEQNPKNIYARAGLLNLASASSLDVGSALQQLLLESPEQAFLYASLGDFYLKRGEWRAAQASYFDAFSRDSKNADYAYNLAVCLDQMAKSKLAIQFYQQALDLEEGARAHFERNVLVARIAVLRGALR